MSGRGADVVRDGGEGAAPQEPPVDRRGRWKEELARNVAEASGSADRASELAELLEARRRERHVVAIQDFPDPDAISSALAYREMARHFEIEVDILYDGRISHPENLALVNLLGIDLVRYRPEMKLDEYDASVFVDNQGTTTQLTGRLESAGVPVLAVVDHHDTQDRLDPLFLDVRPVAAAATLMAEYLQSGRLLQMRKGEAAHVQLATALMHGLHSETDGFVQAREPEYQAAAYLSRFTDAELLEQVLCVQKSRATLEAIRAALENRVVLNGVSVSGVGYVRWADRDAIPQAADFLLTEENVHTVVIFGILRGGGDREVVSGSLRTASPTLGVDEFLKQALGADRSGRFYGGGRSRAGGFEIELGFLAGSDDPVQRDLKWKLYERRVRERLFGAAGVEDSVSDEAPSD